METTASEEGLKRVIGVSGLTLSIISGVIGAGIFALPAIVGISMGAFGVFGYIGCGIMMAAIMLCYAEIGSKVTRSGGSYAYVETAFGPFAGYIVNWLYFFGWGIIGSAALMNIAGDSLAILFPVFLQPFMRAGLFALLSAIMIAINIVGAKQGVGIVKMITVLKLLPLFAIIFLGFGHINSVNLQWQQVPSFKVFGDTTLVLFFAFAGFETSLGASGEIKNPRRTVPMSVVIGAIVVLAVYMLLQTVVQGMLGGQMETFKNAPLAAVAAQLVGPVGATVLLVCAALSCTGNILLDLLCTPRSLFAGANDGLFPKVLGKVHPKFATPWIAVIVYGTLIFIFSLAGGFQQLAVMASAIILIIYLAVILATLKLRYVKKEAAVDSFKAPGGFITPLVGIVTIVWLLSSLKAQEILSTLAFICSVAFLYLVINWRNIFSLVIKPKSNR